MAPEEYVAWASHRLKSRRLLLRNIKYINASCCVIFKISEKFTSVGFLAEFTDLNFSEILKIIQLEPCCCINLPGLPNKVPHAGWLKTAGIYCLKVTEARSLKMKVLAGSCSS